MKKRPNPTRPFVICTIHRSVVVVVVVAFFLGRLGEFLLPARVCLRGVDVREDEIEDFRVPGDGLAFDAFFDVLEM
jgi:hypothetical protein